MSNKVVVVGCGNVGMSYIYALLNQKTNVNELILIDVDKEKIEGEVMDLDHCMSIAPSKINIRGGNYDDCKDAKIVLISAGANQKPGETRMDLINKNSKIFNNIVTNVTESGFNGIFLVATNPMDVMTYLTWKYSKFPANKVLGSGTVLDTSRLKFLIGSKIEVSPKSIHAYVIGEHGDSLFVPWSKASIGLQDIKYFLNEDEMDNICNKVKNIAYEIINKKGATYYGIGMCLVRITNAILDDENSIITISSYDDKNDVYISWPSILNKDGVKSRIDINLEGDEKIKLKYSIDVIKQAIKDIEI